MKYKKFTKRPYIICDTDGNVCSDRIYDSEEEAEAAIRRINIVNLYPVPLYLRSTQKLVKEKLFLDNNPQIKSFIGKKSKTLEKYFSRNNNNT